MTKVELQVIYSKCPVQKKIKKKVLKNLSNIRDTISILSYGVLFFHTVNNRYNITKQLVNFMVTIIFKKLMNPQYPILKTEFTYDLKEITDINGTCNIQVVFAVMGIMF